MIPLDNGAGGTQGDPAEALVVLSLAGQMCGLPVGCVRDVLRQLVIHPVALAAPEIAGHLNLRGHIVTAIDLRRRLGLPHVAENEERQAVVTEEGGEMYALLADRICDVISPDAATFEPLPPTLAPTWARVSAGLFRLPDKLLLVLDLPKLLLLPAAAV